MIITIIFGSASSAIVIMQNAIRAHTLSEVAQASMKTLKTKKYLIIIFIVLY